MTQVTFNQLLENGKVFTALVENVMLQSTYQQQGRKCRFCYFMGFRETCSHQADHWPDERNIGADR